MNNESRNHQQVVLVAAFEGWNDASEAASDAVKHLINRYDSRIIGHIDSDDYYDLQVARPMLCTVLGHKRIVWPQTTLYQARVSEDTELILAIGPEPNTHWLDYCREILAIADEVEATKIISLGSMFADFPHTRALPTTVNDGSDLSVSDETYSGPIGIPTVLTMTAAQMGFDSDSIWVSIPEYLGADDCPEGSLRLLERLSGLLDVSLDVEDVSRRARRWKADAQMLVRYNDMLAHYVHQLEEQTDESESNTLMSAQKAQQLVQETEAYLQSLDQHGEPSK
ncbi:MAG: PAC2 family protein [Bifidobacteriaceae bacterium]|nr:PAC2 family protein [Bifidobacteriaceae bacterium]MCI1979364.1 PAC2 family protein [Bifidobacteriaceae bacterium]